MSKYTTLVFSSDTPESLAVVRELAKLDICKAWSMDHEIHRIGLIEEALGERDIERALEYIAEADVQSLIDRLQAPSESQNGRVAGGAE